MTEDPRFDPAAIRAYLLGGRWLMDRDIAGLIPRTKTAALSAFQVPLPAVPGSFGSVIGFRPEHVAPNVKPRPDEVAKKIAGPDMLNLFDTLPALAALLDDWLGSYGGRQVMLSDLFDRASDEIERITHPQRGHYPPEELDRCISLGNGLLEWSGTSCIHSFRPESEHHGTDYEAYCDKCGFRFVQTDFLPECPLARCEICEAPMDRVRNGRSKTTCSDGCRQRLSRRERAA